MNINGRKVPRREGRVREPGDFYATPEYFTRALLDNIAIASPVWEPACGDGAIVRVLQKSGRRVLASDIQPRMEGAATFDFLSEELSAGVPGSFQDLVTNPPFNQLVPFILRALEVTPGHVALVMPLYALAGLARYYTVFQYTPPQVVLVNSQRLVVNGEVSQFAHVWAVWAPRAERRRSTTLRWIHPSEDGR